MTTNKWLVALRVLFTLCLAGTILFIFFNSAEIGELSGGKSQQVMELLNSLMARLGISFRFSHTLVRKMAHVAEYALLGFWLMLTLRVYTKRILAHISWPLYFGLLVPVLDEAFQLLVPGRAGLVQDILIDYFGVLLGLCFALFLLLLFKVMWYSRQERRAAVIKKNNAVIVSENDSP